MQSRARTVIPPPAHRAAALAAVGTASFGFILGVGLGPKHSLTLPATLLSVTLGLVLAMTPALYVGLSAIRTQLSSRQIVDSLLVGLRAIGLTLLGLAPAALLLSGTSSSRSFVFAITGFGLMAAVFTGLWSFLGAIHEWAGEVSDTVVAGAWALITAALAATIVLEVLQ